MNLNSHIDAEWRTVDEFPMYEINRDKEVRHSMSQRVRRPQFNGQSYLTFTKDGKNYSRTINSIFRKAWPELSSGLPGPGRPRKVRAAISPVTERLEDATTHRYHRIPDFPEYGINKLGDVINLHSRVTVLPGHRGELSVHLRQGDRWRYIAVRKLLRSTFGR